MRCPICGSVLVEGKERRYETLCEHVSDPNGTPSIKPTYVCKGSTIIHLEDLSPLDESVTATCILQDMVFWDEYGEFYVNNLYYSKFYSIEKWLKEMAYNNMLEARDTEARKIQVEIYKKKRIKLFRILCWKWEIHHKFKGDLDGNVTSCKPFVQMFKTTDKGNSWCYTNTTIYDFLESIKCFKFTLKLYRRDKSSLYNQRNLLEKFHPLPAWDRRLYRRLFKGYIRLFYSNIKKEVEEVEEVV